MHDDYGVTYAVYDHDRIPQLMRSPGPVSGGTQREMTMVDEQKEARQQEAVAMVEQKVAREFGWLATMGIRVTGVDIDDQGVILLWVPIEEAEPWKPRAKVVS